MATITDICNQATFHFFNFSILQQVDSAKNKPFKIITLEDELKSMLQNRDKFIQKLGQDTYNRLVEKLETDIQRRKQPESASPS